MKPKLLTGYKVVHTATAKRGMYSMAMHSPSAVVKYIARRWTRPRRGCGPLCVFDNLIRANGFVNAFHGKVYECLYEPSESRYIWMRAYGKKQINSLNSLPRNTVLAKRVKLLRLATRRG